MNRQQPYPTPIQQRRGPPSKRVAPHRIGPTGQREILSNAVGIVPPNLKAFATASQALAQNETTVKPGQASREELLDSSFISRMYSGQIPNQSFPANRLVTALGRELQSNTIEADDYFINHLFPASLLPSGMGDQAMLEELSKPHEGKPSIWNEKEECFRVTPSALNEKHLAAWLNSIGTTLGKAFNYEPLRLWTHISCDEAPLGSNIKRKPDLILLDKKYYDTMSKSIEKVDWAFIRAIAEVTSTDKMTQRIIDTVNTKAYLMYLCQYNRRFVVALSFTAAEGQSFRLTVTDREGQVKWTVGLDGARSKERAALFLRILVVLMFGTSANIGLDPNVEIDGTTGKCVAITLQEKRFEVVDLIYSLDSIVGRGTRVWVVMYNDVKYALKDCWIQHERVDSEISMLKKMKTGEKLTDRVPTLFCGGDVQIDGKIDSTALYRYGLPGWSSKGRRIHRRLVCTPIGEALPEYRSKQEFIKAIISIIITHKTLFNDYGILHRDISLNNILLNRHNVDGAADGLLIDFDYSEELELIDANREQAIEECEAEINEEADAAKAVTGPSRLSAFDSIRTGTPPFMAIEALLAERHDNFAHLPRHDLESILYVILYICTFTNGPGFPRLDFEIPSELSMKNWFTTDTIKIIGNRKIADLCQPERSIISGFTKYWEDFAPFALDLLHLCFPPAYSPAYPNQLTHEGMVSILNKACMAVKESYINMPVTGEKKVKNLKRNESNDPPVPTKKTKRRLEKI